MTIEKCKIINLPKISNELGNLTFIQGGHEIPFQIKRSYYLYDIPGGSTRGSHAHIKLEQFIIAISGSFDIILNDGKNEKRFHMNRSYYGLYLSPLMWRTLDNFSSGSVCMVLASEIYDESDYIRDYNKFKKYTQYYLS